MWYDLDGRVIETQSSGGATTKGAYDGAGRLTTTYTSDGGAVEHSGTPLTTWTAANSVSSDVVLEQTEYTYDADGNVIQTVQRDRFHNDGNTTGALGTLSSGVEARVYYTTAYYDAAG